MGGKISPDNRIIGSVVPAEIRDFLEKQVEAGKFETLSKAIRHYLILAIQSQDPEFSDKIELDNRKPKKSRLKSFWRRS